MLVTCAVATLYVRTAARDIVVGDTSELITASITLGVAHAPGYPLFTILGHLFSLFPIGPLPFRVNVMGALFAAAAVGLVFAIAVRLTGSVMAAAVAALVLSSAPLFWTWALVAEVFSLNNLLVAIFVFLLVVWKEQPKCFRLLLTASLVAGLMLSNQQTSVLLAPAALFLVWSERRVLLARPAFIAACAGALTVGFLLPYAYVPIASARHPVVNWNGVQSLGDLFALILRQSYGTGSLIVGGEHSGGSGDARVAALLASFVGPVGALVLVGAVEAFRCRRWYFWFTLIAFLLGGVWFVWYANLNLGSEMEYFVLQRFFLMSFVVLAPLAAYGVLLSGRGLARVAPPARAYAVPAVAAVAVAACGFIVAANYSRLDQSDNHLAHTFAEDILVSLEPDTILLADGDHVVMALAYAQVVEGVRPDVTLVMTSLLPADWYVRALRLHFPQLGIPFDSYQNHPGALRAFFDANRNRPIAVVGDLPESKDLEGHFWFYDRGIVSRGAPFSEDKTIAELIGMYNELAPKYRVPSAASIKAGAFEKAILVQYALPALRIGREYEHVRRYGDAREWYGRSLAVAPDFKEAREGLARVSRSQ